MNTLDKISLQKFLFEQEPARTDLLKYVTQSTNKKRIKVYRNHSFELIANTIKAYLDYADLNINFEYSDYDDSLSFIDFDDTVDAVLLWVDADRYNIDHLETFINNRIKELRTHYSKPILLGVLGKQINVSLNEKSAAPTTISRKI